MGVLVMLHTGIVGASGYSGVELMRIISGHPEMKISYLTAHTYSGERVSSLYPSLAGTEDDLFREFDPAEAAQSCDNVFFALPHGESMDKIPALTDLGVKVVDLGADYRLRDIRLFKEWYGIDHSHPDLVRSSAYGIPEYCRDEIRDADLVANPGCYPTGALLGIIPLALNGMIGEGPVLIDSKSGASGAGRKLDLALHFSQLDENLKPYSVSGHRHAPEIEEALTLIGGVEGKEICFVPHLVPMVRGILTTIYVPLKGYVTAEDARNALGDCYKDEFFIHVLEKGSYPETKAVTGTNRCHIALELQEGSSTAVVMTAIDNLGKGAAGQAVQNMNLMCGLDEKSGIDNVGLYP